MIEVRNLVKRFGNKEVLKGISFDIQEGSICGFLGPNGAGKTTTIRILTSYFTPTAGRAKIAGYDTLLDSGKVRKKIGYLPESVPLYSDMTVFAYLSYMARLKGIRRRRVGELVDKAIGACQLGDVKDQLIMRLSKGYRQRVGLAQALVHEPEVLILDEPTLGLDPNQIKKTRELIKSNAGAKTVLLSTHILPEVSQICDHVLIIDKGKILAVDKPANLVGKMKSFEGLFLVVRAPERELVGHFNSIDEISDVKIIKREGDVIGIELKSRLGSDLREKLASSIVSRNWGLLELRPIMPDLEDVFHRLTTEEKI